ncbi:G-protein coupled receptor daf-37-like [Palaemon carinicauda]|uniref:G-protein coupled receptor daf-37-like n=1 Tax=Palaemon carinicauda TaxID=392227 RepID=UPI0035B64F54
MEIEMEIDSFNLSGNLNTTMANSSSSSGSYDVETETFQDYEQGASHDYVIASNFSAHLSSQQEEEHSSLWVNNSTYYPVEADGYAIGENISSMSLSISSYERFMDESRHWVQRVLVPLVMCVGVFGNSVSMVVLTRRKMRSSTNNYLTALAISDLLYLVFVFSLSLQHHPDIKQPRHWFYWQYFRYGLWFTDASSSTSIWLTVTFTIERYIAISHPIKGKVLCTVSRAKKVVIIVYLFCWLLTATTPHEWVVITRTSKMGEPFLTLDYSILGQDSTYRHTYYWFTAVTFILLPLCLLVVFNFFLMQAVRRSKLQRRKMTMVSERDHYSHQQEHKITVMLIAVVILALVCQMPTAVLLLYSTVYEPPPKTKAFAIMRGLGNIFNLLNAVNAAANFILYSAFSDKYRRTFLITFVPCAYHQQPQSHSFVTSSDGRRNTADNTSIRTLSRRVSKNSTPSPMPLKESPRMIKSGSFKENGVGALDAKVKLQYGIGRAKRSMNLSPLDAYVQINNSDMSSRSPSYDSSSNRIRSNYNSSVRCRRDLQCFDSYNYGNSDFENEANNHCKANKDGSSRRQGPKSEADKMIDIITVETVTPSSFSSLEDTDPIHFKFIDDESLDICRSPSSSIRRPKFTFSEDGGSHFLGSCESPGSSLPALSPGSTVKSSDSSKETTILSPD